MPRSTLLKHLHDLVSKDELKTALKVLQDFLEDSLLLKNAILLNRRLTAIDKEVAKGTVSFEDSTLTKNQITDGLLSLLTEIEELGANPDIRAEIDAQDNENLPIRFTDQHGTQRSERLGDIISKNLVDDKQEISQLTTELHDLTQTLEKKDTVLDHLELQIFKLKTTLVEKNQQLEENEKRFETMALEINGKDLSTFPRLYAEAYEYFLKGDVKKALEILDRQKMLDHMESRKKLREEEDQEAAKEWILRADLLQAEHRYNEVGECFEFAAKLHLSWDNCLEAGKYFEFVNDYNKAKSFYNKCLNIWSTETEKAETFHSLARLFSKINEFNQAEPYYRETLTIQRKLVKEDPQMHLPYLATTLNSIANIYRAKNDFDQAELKYKEALEIRKKLAKESPKSYLSDLGITLNNLAVLYWNQDKTEQAEYTYHEALKIRRTLVKGNPKAYLFYLADTLNNVGILYREKKELIQAESVYKEALEIYRKLADLNPKAYLFKMATTLNNLGILYMDKQKFTQAELLLYEALEIRKKLARENFQPYLADVGMTLSNLAILHNNKHEYTQSESNLEEALKIYQKLTLENPKVYLPYLIHSQSNMAVFFQGSLENKTRSILLAKEAIENAQNFKHIPFAKEALNRAYDVLKNWEINIEAFKEEHGLSAPPLNPSE